MRSKHLQDPFLGCDGLLGQHRVQQAVALISVRPMKARAMHQLLLLPTLIGAAALPRPSLAACNIVEGKAYGECSGVKVTSGEKRSFEVRTSVHESSIISGAIVHSGGFLRLSGISNGDIVVNQGGRLEVTGVVNGTVHNLGGKVEIEGIVERLHSSEGKAVVGGQVGIFNGTGPATFKKGAILQGQPLPRLETLPKHQ